MPLRREFYVKSNMSEAKHHKSKKNSIINKFVVLNEEELIRFVQARPILYDKSLKGYRKTNIRQQVWRDLALKMGDLPVEECRKRWRSLRDSFTKHYKISMRLEADELAKKKKWLFYDQMTFLAPYLDKSTYETDRMLLDCYGDNSNSNDSSDVLASDFLKPSESFLEEEKLNQDEELENLSISPCNEEPKSLDSSKIEEISEVQDINASKDSEVLNHFSTLNEINYEEVNEAHHSDSIDNFANDNNNHVGSYCRNNEIAVQVSSPNYDVLDSHSCSDPDAKFLMSCLPALKRLSHRKNSLARLKIQKILYEIEFGTVEDLS